MSLASGWHLESWRQETCQGMVEAITRGQQTEMESRAVLVGPGAASVVWKGGARQKEEA